jgi:hypothetical protein
MGVFTEHGELCDAAHREFNDTYVEMFIERFAEADDPINFLEDNGIGENHRKKAIGAELLQCMAGVWVNYREGVFHIVGSLFWRTMKEMAQEAFDSE